MAALCSGLFLVVACTRGGHDADVRPAAAPTASARSAPALDRSDAVGLASASASSEADAGAAESLDFASYYSLRMDPYDVRRALERTYDGIPPSPASLPALPDAVVLCRVAIVEPAPKPKSVWDQRNGRDLMLETIIDGVTASRKEGPLGGTSFVVPAEDEMAAAASGTAVRWVLHDRDQKQAFPYVTSIALGSIDLPKGPMPSELAAPTMKVSCRTQRSDEAAIALIPAADRALDEAEKATAWGPDDPRPVESVRSALTPAGDAIRIGRAIGLKHHHLEAWAPREARLAGLVRKYRAREREWFASAKKVPMGEWAPVGSSVEARVGAFVCPALTETDDPGSINEEQRTGCALSVELRLQAGAAPVHWDVDPYGPAYACRDHGPLGIEVLRSPGQVGSACVTGFRQGKTWRKKLLELSAKTPTVALLRGEEIAGALRIWHGKGSNLFAVPPAPPK